ncbi:Signal peptidase complex subunit [Dimargaris verticillata]|uniref:Signal peptidase subunit 3 n=1 Tax=Dimargaris verticillata TaxID=2761393 RepID=A0A9W8EBK5_9FUNG|nr:Signal peptidase complex subunit [Dimargaris verticillata]
MYNQLQRLNGVATFALTVAFCLFVAISYVSDYTRPVDQGTAQVTVRGIKVQRGPTFPDAYDPKSRQSHYARLAMDIEVDLTRLFDWNTKQVFLMAVAEYATPTHPVNQVVLWDSIIQSPEDAEFKLKKYRNKYQFKDFTEKFGTKTANLTVYWDVTPYVGFLQTTRLGQTSQTFTIPEVSYK